MTIVWLHGSSATADPGVRTAIRVPARAQHLESTSVAARGGGHVIGPSRSVGDDWVPRAQSGQAREVLEEIDAAVRTGLEPRDKVTALFARAVARSALGAEPAAVSAARELCTLCRELNLVAAGVRARALLAELLRSSGQLEQAVEQLATAVAQEPGLRDLTDPDVQSALVNLAVALRMSGVFEEGRRVEARLAPVESLLARPLRIARCSNHAFRHAVQAMGAARRPPFRADARLLRQATEEIGRALLLGGDDVYDVVGDEARVLGALHESVIGNPDDGMRRLDTCRGLLQREREAATAQLLWGAARVRALRRLGRLEEAAATGRDLLAAVKGSGEDGDRLVLAYEVMRAEHREAQTPGWGAATYVELAEDRLVRDNALVAALFRARVDLLRGADERRVLARAASLDSLTGLVNRRGAAAAIAEAATRQRNEHVALLMIDLDGFKNVNDVCGHLAGDAVLQRVAAALRTAARTEDMVARWGGDEFVVVAVLDPDRAVALADRLRETVRECADVGAADAVTASVGIAVRDVPIDDESWLRRADEAMYDAKRSGGDAAVLG